MNMTPKLIATMLGIGIFCLIAVTLPFIWATAILSIPIIITFFLWSESISEDKILVPFLVKIGGGIIAAAACIILIRAISSYFLGNT